MWSKPFGQADRGPRLKLIKDKLMDQDPAPGEAERMKGSIKEAIGKLTGDTKAQAEGRAEKAGGKPEGDAAVTESRLPDTTENRT